MKQEPVPVFQMLRIAKEDGVDEYILNRYEFRNL